MCIMHPKYKSTPATNSCNRGGFIRKGVLTLPAPFFTQLQINLWYKNFMYVCSSREMVPSLRQKTHPVCRDRAIHPQCRFFHPVSFPQIRMNTPSPAIGKRLPSCLPRIKYPDKEKSPGTRNNTPIVITR